MSELRIEMPPELEERLREEAGKHGQKAADYARALLEASLGNAQPNEGPPAWAGLARRRPEDLDDLARVQGAPLAVRFDDLIGDFWPDDESSDEFIAAVRQWRREGTEARRRRGSR